MNKEHVTILASIAAVTVVATMLMFSGILNFADAKTSSQYSVDRGIGSQLGAATKIIVDIDSPYGQETISSFDLIWTDNLMKKEGYTVIRLMGQMMQDKVTLLKWLSADLRELPAGLTTEYPMVSGGNKPTKMAQAPPNANITKIPMSGKVTVKMLESSMDMFDTKSIRTFEFSGCFVAGYFVGSMYDDRKQIFKDGLQHFEEIDFACKYMKNLTSMSGEGNRGINVQTAINNDDRKITNEKGELIITNREYRQPIVMEDSSKNVEGSKYVKRDLVTRTELDKTSYKIGDVATFTITFTDAEGNTIDPDTIRAVYDSKLIQLEKKDAGIYTYTTSGLTKEAHQIIVSAEKTGFPTDTSYLSIPIHRIS